MSEKLPPYLYRDKNEELHIDIPKFLQEMGIPDTDENREIATQAAMEAVKEKFPNTEVKIFRKES